MSDSTLINLCESIESIGAKNVCLCGGEPTLRMNTVLSMIEILKKYAETVSLTTNGILISNQVAKNLKNSGIDAVQVSIDGNEIQHNWLRCSDYAYARASESVEHLLNNDVEVSISFIPNTLNFNCFENIVKKFSELGVASFRVQPLLILGRAKHMSDYILNDAQIIKFGKIIDRLGEDYDCLIEWKNPVDYMDHLINADQIEMISIDDHGNLMLIPYVPLSFGNISNHTLGEYCKHGLTVVNKIKSVRRILSKILDLDSYSVFNGLSLKTCDIIENSVDEVNDEISSWAASILEN